MNQIPPFYFYYVSCIYKYAFYYIITENKDFACPTLRTQLFIFLAIIILLCRTESSKLVIAQSASYN